MDIREAEATLVRAEREHDATWWGLGPTLSATASYTRNQEEIVVALPQIDVVTTPIDQLDLTLRAELDIVDVPSWSRIDSSGDRAIAEAARADAARLRVEEDVVRAYYDRVAAEGVEDAATNALDVARHSLLVVVAKREAGIGSDLDEQRARLEIAQRMQTLADARSSRERSERRLRTSSGLAADGRAPLLAQDLSPPAPLSARLASAPRQPAVRAAVADEAAARAEATEAWSALAPRITAVFSERITNAAGFGPSPFWSAGATATWRLDPASIGDGRAREASEEVARVRTARALEDALDTLRDRHADVETRIAQLRAATSERDASSLAATVARARHDAGTATSLDRLLAERDDLAARVAETRARAQLALARALLDLASRSAGSVQ